MICLASPLQYLQSLPKQSIPKQGVYYVVRWHVQVLRQANSEYKNMQLRRPTVVKTVSMKYLTGLLMCCRLSVSESWSCFQRPWTWTKCNLATLHAATASQDRSRLANFAHQQNPHIFSQAMCPRSKQLKVPIIITASLCKISRVGAIEWYTVCFFFEFEEHINIMSKFRALSSRICDTCQPNRLIWLLRVSMQRCTHIPAAC